MDNQDNGESTSCKPERDRPRDKNLGRFLSFVRVASSGCWVWEGGIGAGGYGYFWIDGATRRAHRVSYELHKGEIPKGRFVLHSCDVRACVNPDHLRCGSAQENADDMIQRGRQVKSNHPRPRGDKNGNSKLTWGSVKAIRELLSRGLKQRDIAKQFGVAQPTVYKINVGLVWKEE